MKKRELKARIAELERENAELRKQVVALLQGQTPNINWFPYIYPEYSYPLTNSATWIGWGGTYQ
jgi:hypothetical protein